RRTTISEQPSTATSSAGSQNRGCGELRRCGSFVMADPPCRGGAGGRKKASAAGPAKPFVQGVFPPPPRGGGAGGGGRAKPQGRFPPHPQPLTPKGRGEKERSGARRQLLKGRWQSRRRCFTLRPASAEGFRRPRTRRCTEESTNATSVPVRPGVECRG